MAQHGTVIRLYEGAKIYFLSKDHRKYYILKNNVNVGDITASLKEDQTIPLSLRQPLIEGKRRIYIFKYTSEGNEVAGYLSILTDGPHPTVVFLRGGNGNFGILRPNNTFSFLDGFNVIGTLYRGNVYAGKDDFGGDDINDVENLIRFIPELERQTHEIISQPFAMIGVSRGAMQMFGTLAKSMYVKNIIKKAVSLSGNTDLVIAANQRPEMKYLFKTKFDEQNKVKSLQEWLSIRNPVALAPLLNKHLSVMMIYGLKDNRVDISEQKNFLKALNANAIQSKFIPIKNAGHDMDGHVDEVKKMIVDFLEN